MFEFIFAIFPFIWFGIFIFVILSIVSPKFRGKIMSNQVKAVKHMTDYSKEDLKTIADTEVEISASALKKKAKAIKEGLTEEKMYCKHCGSLIDNDSTFCKKCGKKQ